MALQTIEASEYIGDSLPKINANFAWLQSLSDQKQALDPDLTAIASLSGNGYLFRQDTNWSLVSGTGGDAGVVAWGNITGLLDNQVDLLVWRTDAEDDIAALYDDIASLNTAVNGKQALDADLTAIAALSTTGYARRTGTNTWALSTSIPQSDVTGLSTSLAALQPLDADLTAIAAFSGTGYARRTGTNTWTTERAFPAVNCETISVPISPGQNLVCIPTTGVIAVYALIGNVDGVAAATYTWTATVPSGARTLQNTRSIAQATYFTEREIVLTNCSLSNIRASVVNDIAANFIAVTCPDNRIPLLDKVDASDVIVLTTSNTVIVGAPASGRSRIIRFSVNNISGAASLLSVNIGTKPLLLSVSIPASSSISVITIGLSSADDFQARSSVAASLTLSWSYGDYDIS